VKRASFGLSAIGEGDRAGGLPKNTRKKRDLCGVFVGGLATKRVLISGEKDSREPPAWSRARERRSVSNKILLQLDALHGADFTVYFPALFRFSQRFSYSFHKQLFTYYLFFIIIDYYRLFLIFITIIAIKIWI